MLFTINHLWYTLEAVCYGLVSGCSLCAVIMWFTCYQEVMTSDKFLYLFGKPFPGTSLLITMTLRFIPQLQQNRREIRQSQAMLQKEGTRLLQRLGSALRNLSVLLTMSMEAAVETADSMKARGYGAKRRTTFHLFRFDGRDARTLGLILAVAGVCITARSFGHGYMEFYPAMTPVLLGSASYTMFAFYAVLMFLPGILETKEAIRWRSYGLNT